MKHVRFTNAHQSITFSRRMMLLGGAQAAVGAMLIGRMGWLAVAQNEKYQLLSESNRVQLIPVPPRRGWLIDRQGKPIAINRRASGSTSSRNSWSMARGYVAQLAQLMQLHPDEVDRINAELATSAVSGRSRSRTTCPTSNMPPSLFASRSFPGVRGTRLHSFLPCRRRGWSARRICRCCFRDRI